MVKHVNTCGIINITQTTFSTQGPRGGHAGQCTLVCVILKISLTSIPLSKYTPGGGLCRGGVCIKYSYCIVSKYSQAKNQDHIPKKQRHIPKEQRQIPKKMGHLIIPKKYQKVFGYYSQIIVSHIIFLCSIHLIYVLNYIIFTYIKF